MKISFLRASRKDAILQTKTALHCHLCKEDVYMDIDDIWCACHIQKTVECVTGVQPSFWAHLTPRALDASPVGVAEKISGRSIINQR